MEHDKVTRLYAMQPNGLWKVIYPQESLLTPERACFVRARYDVTAECTASSGREWQLTYPERFPETKTLNDYPELVGYVEGVLGRTGLTVLVAKF